MAASTAFGCADEPTGGRDRAEGRVLNPSPSAHLLLLSRDISTRRRIGSPFVSSVRAPEFSHAVVIISRSMCKDRLWTTAQLLQSRRLLACTTDPRWATRHSRQTFQHPHCIYSHRSRRRLTQVRNYQRHTCDVLCRDLSKSSCRGNNS